MTCSLDTFTTFCICGTDSGEGRTHLRPENILKRIYYIVEARFGNVNVDVTHLHVDPQALHHRQTVLVIPQVLQAHVQSARPHILTELQKIPNVTCC